MLQLRFGFAFLAAALAVSGAVTNAIEISLSAVQDATVIEKPNLSQATTNNGTLLQVWNNGSSNSNDGRRRDAFFQFDLSTVGPGYEIKSARLEFYDTGLGDHAGSQASSYTHQTYVMRLIGSGTDADKLVVNGVGGPVAFDKDGMHEENVTYLTFNTTTIGTPKLSLRTNNAEWSWDAGPLSSMDLALDPNNATGYQPGGQADAEALQILNEENVNRGYILFEVNWLVGGRTFGDRESDNPIKLVLDIQQVPEPGSASLVVAGIVLGSSRLRRHRRPLAA